MKKLIVTCSMLIAISMVSFAQTAAPAANKAKQTKLTSEDVAGRRAKMYQQQYGLTAEQYKGVYAAELDLMKQNEQMTKNGMPPGDGQMTQMKMTRDAKIKSVMTADQYAKYSADQTPNK